MKIFYVKNNNDRVAEFQLQTLIYEDNGKMFVKKKALSPKAFPHIAGMKDNYLKLSSTIVNPKIKLAEILYQSEECLIFEFIDGCSLKKKMSEANIQGKQEVDYVLNEYFDLLKTGFKTTFFDSSSMVTDRFRELFGEGDYSDLDGEICFDGISNLDLIFSNIIYKEEFVYLIDYEWVFDLNLTVGYVASRALQEYEYLFNKMEKHFLGYFVNDKRGGNAAQQRYLKTRKNIFHYIAEKEEEIQDQNKEILRQQDIAQSLRLKNRFKKIFKH
jgi:hypothetical protein